MTLGGALSLVIVLYSATSANNPNEMLGETMNELMFTETHHLPLLTDTVLAALVFAIHCLRSFACFEYEKYNMSQLGKPHCQPLNHRRRSCSLFVSPVVF